MVRRLLAAPLTWLVAIVVVTDVRAWVRGSELGWFAGLATTLIVAAIALVVWTLREPAWRGFMLALCIVATFNTLHLVVTRLMLGEPDSPRITGALIALAVPLAPLVLLPVLTVGLLASQSYLAIAAASIGLACRTESTWSRRLCALVSVPLLCSWLVVVRPTTPQWLPRFETWTHYAWPTFLERPWFGWGPGAWAETVGMAQWSARAEFISGHAHSDPVEWAVEYGLLGFGLLAGFLVTAWATFARSPVRGTLAASAVLSLGLHVWHIPFLMPWLALAVGLGLLRGD